MYRPKRSDLRRDKVIGVRLTEEEMKLAQKHANCSCISLSSWAREILRDYLKMLENEQ